MFKAVFQWVVLSDIIDCVKGGLGNVTSPVGFKASGYVFLPSPLWCY